MNRQELLNQIEHYTPFNEQEETDKQLILNWIRNNTNAFSRENTVAHMTASAWVVNQDKSKILMVYHNILVLAGRTCGRGDRFTCSCPSGSERGSGDFPCLSCI